MPKQLKKIFHYDFDSKDDYVAHFCDPKRVTCLEWRKSRQQNFGGWTSHSWLEAYLLDGSHTRYDFYADRGLMESLNGEPDPMSQVYLGRGAEAHEFGHPLTLQVLREKVAMVGARPYSVFEFNCHHFVLEVWNSCVIEALRCTHFPDRWKLSFVYRVGPLRNWLGGIGASLSSTSGANDKETEADLLRLCGVFQDESGRYFVSLKKDDVDSYVDNDHCSMPCLGECPKVCDRESEGMFTATGGSRSNGHFKEYMDKEHDGGKKDESIPSPSEFASVLESGKLVHLNKERELTTVTLPLQESGAEVANARAKDIVDSWARVPKSKSGGNSSFSSVSMMSSSLDWLSNSIATMADTCSTLLQSAELRLVKPDIHKSSRLWRLRMLLRNAGCGNRCQYSLQDIPDTVELTSLQHCAGTDLRHIARRWYTLQDIAQEELPDVKAALATDERASFFRRPDDYRFPRKRILVSL